MLCIAPVAACTGANSTIAASPMVALVATSTETTTGQSRSRSAGVVIGGMNGEACVAKPPGAAWNPVEDLCVVFPGDLPASISAVVSPAAPVAVVYPALGNQHNVAEFRIAKSAGITYTVTVTGQSGKYQPNPAVAPFWMPTYTVAQLQAQQSIPTAHFASYYGAFLRSGLQPFGIYSATQSSGALPFATNKIGNAMGLGVQIARMYYQPFNDDLTRLFGKGAYNWSVDDETVQNDLDNHVTPYVDLEAGPVQYGFGNTQPLYHNPNEFQSWCLAVASHVHQRFPSIGASVPAVFGLPANEPNNGTSAWDASRTDNPSLFGYNSIGPGVYMKQCYSALKSVFPDAMVYGPELNVGAAAIDPITFFTTLYSGAGCRVGKCFDGIALHLTPAGDPLAKYSACAEHNFGWTLRCYRDLQAISVAHGDPKPPVLITEVVLGSVPNSNGATDEAGQAWWMSRMFTAFNADPSVKGVFWANIDEDADYVGTPFFGGSIVDTSGGGNRQKPGYAVYRKFASL